MAIDVILVPQGVEYQTVVRGVRQAKSDPPSILPIPIGANALGKYLASSLQSSKLFSQFPLRVVVLGLCGSLSPQFQYGDMVIYQECLYIQKNSVTVKQAIDKNFTTWLKHKLPEEASVVSALTSDKIVCTQVEKSRLYQQTQAEVVDMEGFTILQQLNSQGMVVGIVRVVSDNSDQNLPELNSALSGDGVLLTLPLIKSFLGKPRAAVSLIRGSWQGLQVLQQVANTLVSE